MSETPCAFMNPGFEDDMEDHGIKKVNMPDDFHIKSMKQVDQMHKELEALKETLIKNRVKCHMLEVDLATQFSPYMVEIIRNTEQNCKSCAETLEKCQQIPAAAGQ